MEGFRRCKFARSFLVLLNNFFKKHLTCLGKIFVMEGFRKYQFCEFFESYLVRLVG